MIFEEQQQVVNGFPRFIVRSNDLIFQYGEFAVRRVFGNPEYYYRPLTTNFLLTTEDLIAITEKLVELNEAIV